MKNLGKSAIWVVVLLIISKILGLLREVLLAQKFGVSNIVDAYTICASVPTVLFTLFVGVFSAAYVPVYFRIDTERERNKFFSNTLTFLLAISVVAAIACWVFSETVVKLFAPGFQGETARMTNSFVKCVCLYLPFYAAFSVLSSQSMVFEEFVYNKLCYFVILNVVIVLSILLASNEKPIVLVYGLDLSIALAAIILLALLSRKGEAPYSPSLKLNDENMKMLFRLSVPIGISSIISELNTVIDRMFSSSLGEGITSALNYANRLQQIPYTMIVMVILELCYPRMNKCFADGEKEKGLEYASRSFGITCYFAIPAVTFMFLFSTPIVKLLFERGAFDAKATEITANCLKCYSIGVMFELFRLIETRTLTANLKQKTVLGNTILVVVTNIILNFILVPSLGYIGLPLATSASSFIAFAVISFYMKKLGLNSISFIQLKDVWKVFSATIVAVAVLFALFFILNDMFNGNLLILIGMFLAIIVFVLMTVLLKSESFFWIYRNLPSKLQIIKIDG